MMSGRLCDQHHGYDTGLFDAVVRSLLASVGRSGDNSKGLHAEAEPLDNVVTIAMIWFLFGVILVLVIGVVLLLILGRISEGDEDDEDDEYFVDQEKQVPTAEEEEA